MYISEFKNVIKGTIHITITSYFSMSTAIKSNKVFHRSYPYFECINYDFLVALQDCFSEILKMEDGQRYQLCYQMLGLGYIYFIDIIC